MSREVRDRVRVWAGWIAAILATLLFISFIDQIRLNLSGQKGSLILPLVAIFNCTAWVLYGAMREKKEWPMIIPNAIGILVASFTALTAI